MQILIDADGCPVVDITVRVAREQGLQCLILCDTAHQIEQDGAQTKVVSQGADSVDFALVNLVKAGDIVVTQDCGLAAMCLARKAVPVNQNGLCYTDENIDTLLLQRHTAKKVRRAGGHLKGSAKRKPEQDVVFEAKLRELIAQNG
ncbi:MAG: YaiI/YqxD family protein [Oscillospiraceae bacterium]